MRIDETIKQKVTFHKQKRDIFRKGILDLEGKQEPYKQWTNCWYRKHGCNQLVNGRLYPCPRAAKFKYYNQNFNCGIVQSETDYLDIHSVNNKQQVYDFLSKPVDFCRYCDFNEEIKRIPWEISKREASAWLK